MDIEISESTKKLDPVSDKGILTNTSERLAHARTIEEKIRSVKRLDDSDRLIFARNLGYIFEQIRHDSNVNYSKIFYMAFNSQIAESLIKKRKTLILVDDELTNSSGLCSTPDKYLKLLKVLAGFLYPSSSDNLEKKMEKSLVRLVEKSSFDYSGSVSDRLKTEYTEEISLRLNQIVKRVVDSVDMNWMYQFGKNHNIPGCGYTGKLESAGKQGASGRINLSIHQAAQGIASPSVNLMERLFPAQGIDMSNFLMVTIEESNSTNTTIERLKTALVEKVCSSSIAIKKFKDSASIWPLPESLLDADESHELLVEEIFDSLIEETSYNKNLYNKVLVDLEIRFDPDFNQWKPVLIHRFNLYNMDQEDDIRSTIFCNSQGDEALFLGILDYHGDKGVYAINSLGQDGHNYALFVADWHFLADLIDSEDSPFALFAEDEWIRDQGFLDGTDEFQRILFHGWPNIDLNGIWNNDMLDDGQSHKTFYTNASNNFGYSQAPTGTIASLILQNMAYAEDSKRIDNLLIQDAKAKYQIIKQCSDDLEKNYIEAMSARFN